MKGLWPKCVVCDKACRKNQKKLPCAICGKFVHRKCSNLTATDIYRHEELNVPFYCQRCNETIYPLSTEDDLGPILNLSNTGQSF